MIVRNVTIDCDTPGCDARVDVPAHDIERATSVAAYRFGWSTSDGEDFCGTCTRTPASAGRETGP